MGTRETGKHQGPGNSKAAATGSGNASQPTSKIHDEGSPREDFESLSVEEPEEKGPTLPRVIVDGVAAKSFYCMMRRPVFLVTDTEGQHETTRIHLSDARKEFRIGALHTTERLGPAVISEIRVKTGLQNEQPGMWIYTSRGTVFVSITDCMLTYT